MRRIFVFALLSFSTCVNLFSQDFRQAADGIEYAEMTREIDELPVKINLLRLDLSKIRLDVVHAKDAAIGLEKTSTMAVRHGAFAAINAGFFRIDKSIFEGDDVGILKIDGKLLSESYANRIALLIKNNEARSLVSFEHLNSSIKLSTQRRTLQITGMNRQPAENDIILLTPEFHRTTLTNPGGLEIIVRKNRISKIIVGKGSSEIPPYGFVISVTGDKRQALQQLTVGRRISVGLSNSHSPSQMFELSNSKIASAEDVVSGVPQLIKNGKIEITWEQEKSSKSFVDTKHPRTAVGQLKDGKFLMVTVDGRSETSSGIALPALAAFLLEMGATDAMNLDGGGSTTMFLQGKVVNHPSDKEGERSVGDAILVTLRKKDQPRTITRIPQK